MALPASFLSWTAATAPPPPGSSKLAPRGRSPRAGAPCGTWANSPPPPPPPPSAPAPPRPGDPPAPARCEWRHDRYPHGPAACRRQPGRGRSPLAVQRPWTTRSRSGARWPSHCPRSSSARAARRGPAASTPTSRPRAWRRCSTSGRRSALSDEQNRRISARLGPVVRAVAQDTRSQSRNRELALERLRGRLEGALAVQRPRRATKPTAASAPAPGGVEATARGDVKRPAKAAEAGRVPAASRPSGAGVGVRLDRPAELPRPALAVGGRRGGAGGRRRRPCPRACAGVRGARSRRRCPGRRGRRGAAGVPPSSSVSVVFVLLSRRVRGRRGETESPTPRSDGGSALRLRVASPPALAISTITSRSTIPPAPAADQAAAPVDEFGSRRGGLPRGGPPPARGRRRL